MQHEIKLKHVFLSWVLFSFLPPPCCSANSLPGSIAVTKPLHEDMPNALSNTVFISLNNRASNFQIFAKCSPQRTLTTCFSNFPQTFKFW